MNELRKTLLSLTTIVILFAGIDCAVNYVCGRLLDNMPDSGTDLSKINFSLRRADPDILIVGSSRANHHYDSRLLEDSLKCRV